MERADRAGRSVGALFGLVVPALIVGACGTGLPSQTPVPFSLNGTSWRATDVDGLLPAAGHDITIQFSGDQVTGTTGCNGFGGELVPAGDRVGIELGLMTAAACAEAAPADVEARVLEVLREAAVIEARPERLVVRSAAGEITYVPAPPPAP